MITKRVAAHKKGPKAKAGGLIRYIVDAKHEGAKVERLAFANCYNDDYECVIREIEAVQGMNTRSQIDKTYHLVVSFQEGEAPTADILDDIEQEIATSLGYGVHQRVSAVHHDTDNLHMHMVINKVHPERFTVHEPYYDHYKLGELCQSLEIKHGLQVDKHAESKKTRASRNIDTDELKKDGIVPLNEWLKTNLDLEQMTCWEDLHEQAALAGVSLVLKGNGLALVDDRSGIGVKASSVSRTLSKANLVKQWGDFQPKQKTYSAKQQYDGQAALKGRASQSSEYWTAYQLEKERLSTFKREELLRLRQYQSKERKRISDKSSLERARIKLGRTIRGSEAKKKAYQIISEQRKKSLADLNALAKTERQKIYAYTKTISWRQFLSDKASAGDEQALTVLRRLKPEKIAPKNFFSGTDNGLLIADKTMKLKDNGHATYQPGKVTVVDSGDKIFFRKGFDDTSLAFAIELARSKFTEIKAHGSTAFKTAVEKSMRANQMGPSSKTSDKAGDPIDHFIVDRNKTAERVKDLKPHVKLAPSTSGKFNFAGLRRVGDRYALLCENKESIGVLEINKKSFDQLNKTKRDTEIKINNGVPSPGGRKR